jgi:PEGA domain-containing protein
MKLQILCILIFASAALSQAGVPAATMARTEDGIRREYPNVSAETLTTDRLVVEGTFARVQSRLRQKGFSDTEIAEIVMSAWSGKRKDANVKLTEAVLLEEVLKHGILVVDSEPAGASVTIDREKAKDTQCEKYVLGGTHHVRITKEGYFPEEGDQSVTPETRVIFKRKLRPVSGSTTATPH